MWAAPAGGLCQRDPRVGEAVSQLSLPRVPQHDFFLWLLERPPPWMAGSVMLWGGSSPKRLQDRKATAQSLSQGTGLAPGGPSLPFPVPHLQRPSNSGSHSRDSTPREQLSEGLVGQHHLCLCHPSLSLVWGVQGQAFGSSQSIALFPHLPLPLSPDPLSLSTPSLSLPLFLSCSLPLTLALWSRPVWQGSTHTGHWAGRTECTLPSELAFPAWLPSRSSLGNLPQCEQPSSFLTVLPLWDPKGLACSFHLTSPGTWLFPTPKGVLKGPGRPRVPLLVRRTGHSLPWLQGKRDVGGNKPMERRNRLHKSTVFLMFALCVGTFLCFVE